MFNISFYFLIKNQHVRGFMFFKAKKYGSLCPRLVLCDNILFYFPKTKVIASRENPSLIQLYP